MMNNKAMGLDEATRKKSAEILGVVLASTYTLFLKTQRCHWNVTGPNFVSLHELFDKQYNELSEEVDEIAERIRAMDHKAPASFAEFIKLSVIPDEKQPQEAKEMIAMLLSDHEKMAATCRNAIESLDEMHDIASADELTEQLAFHEKQAWILRVQIG